MKTSNLVQAFRRAFEVLQVITTAVFKRGGNDEHIEAILKNQKLVDQIADLIVGVTKAAKDLVVNHCLSLKDAIDAGTYDWVNSDINESNFPSSEHHEHTYETRLFHFDCDMDSDEVIKKMKEDGFDSADLRTGLAYGEKNPDVQREFPVILLGSVVRLDGYRCVPCLGGDGSDRGLRLDYCGGWWSRHYRFLGVRKVL